MKTFTLHILKCFETEDWGSDECALKILVDDQHVTTFRRSMSAGDEWHINQSFQFVDKFAVVLYDEDAPDGDDKLGQHIITSVTQPLTMASLSFREDDADYTLTFSIALPDSNDTHGGGIDGAINLRRFLARLGAGVANEAIHKQLIIKQSLYQAGGEVISFRDTRALHDQQDGNKSGTLSLRQWLATHANYWSAETFLTNKPAYRNAAEVFAAGNWETVVSEVGQRLAGFAHYSRITTTDNPFSHETMDWNMDIIPDPVYMYMLGSGMKGKGQGLDFIPLIHNELETGSFPIQWRPFWGEYVTLEGRHIWDVGHSPVSAEIHPAHSIVREHTTAGPLGNHQQMVPVNRAIIGMGLSGGFPGDSGSRWQAEFGGIPAGVRGDTKDCWPTNLKKHPLTFRLFPPVPRPNAHAELRARIVLCKYISVENWQAGDRFLELTQNDNPAMGGEGLGFRDFMNADGYPSKNCPQAYKPQFKVGKDTDNLDAYYDVAIDLSSATDIPVGYYAIVECGWSTKGAYKLQKYDVVFQKLTALETEERWDDWHLQYGVNGQWDIWYTDNEVFEKKTYTHNKKFTLWTIDSLPIVLRDCGIEWDGTDFANERLGITQLIITPDNADNHDHLAAIVKKISKNKNTMTLLTPENEQTTDQTQSVVFKLKSSVEATQHEWQIKVSRVAAI